jgi:hypothetical protein
VSETIQRIATACAERAISASPENPARDPRPEDWRALEAALGHPPHPTQAVEFAAYYRDRIERHLDA